MTEMQDKTTSLQGEIVSALSRLEQAPPFEKARHQGAVLDLAEQLLVADGGIESLYELAPRFDSAGLFLGTDWANANTLLPSLVKSTLEYGEPSTVTLECLSELRMLATANGVALSPSIPPEHAKHFLTQVLALNLQQVFGTADETLRVRLGPLGAAISKLFRYHAEHIGYEDILVNLIDEIWRILAQRPIQVGQIQSMVAQIAIVMSTTKNDMGEARLGADRLVSALFGPTQTCKDDPGIPVYQERLAAMDQAALQQESYGFARSMHDVGLVSDYHVAFVRWLVENSQTQLLPDALGLSSTGLDALRCCQTLVETLISEAIHIQTSQALYGLTMLLETGLLYSPPIPAAFWRQIGLQVSPHVELTLNSVFGEAVPARVRVLAGVISILGQPFGVGQGNNPTCQSARAISMWAYNDPDYLMHLIASAARFDEIHMHFEGQVISSANLPAGMSAGLPLDTDAVSVLLVPHLDRIYLEMGRRCQGREGDPHRWINPEFHGWWVGREFMIAVDVASGSLHEYDNFVRQFYCSYHPYYNGNQPVIHMQPAGIAVTDSSAQFVGWHAVTIIRVALDQDNVMRVYFYNPNNDSGQSWGNGVLVSTHGKGERSGEASLPFAQFASRLYIFHDDSLEIGSKMSEVAIEEIEEVKALATESWAANRVPTGEAVAKAQ